MIARVHWCASLTIFLLITFCGSTTGKLTAWSTRCWTAAEEEHPDDNEAAKFCYRNEMGAGGWLFARCARRKYDPCLRNDRHGWKRKYSRRGRCLRSGGADAQEYSVGIGARRCQHERCRTY